MSLRTQVACGHTTLELLRRNNSILTEITDGVGLLGVNHALFKANWDPEARGEVRLFPKDSSENVGIIKATIDVRVIPTEKGSPNTALRLSDMGSLGHEGHVDLHVQHEDSPPDRVDIFRQIEITGPPILCVLSCVLQHEGKVWIALYRKGGKTMHLYLYTHAVESSRSGDLAPLSPATVFLPAAIHGMAALHSLKTFVIATCERDSSYLFMKPDSCLTVELHTYSLSSAAAPTSGAGVALCPPPYCFDTRLRNLGMRHAEEAFSAIMELARDTHSPAPEKAPLISALASVYDAAMRAAAGATTTSPRHQK